MEMTILLQQSSCAAATDTFGRFRASQVHPRVISQLKLDRSSVSKHKWSPLQIIRRNMKNVAVVHASAAPEVTLHAHHHSHRRHHFWKFRIFATIVTIFLSFFKGKWGPLLLLKEKVETAIEELEEISEVVEEVADAVEELAETAAKNLPEGKLHDAAEFIDKLAQEVEKDAHIAGHLLEKVEETLERKVDSFIDSHTRSHKEKTAVSE
ncbi:hypothetical protein K1719_022021 [Acacia pycnantha]|nr:hypothetical protein K1719_022021 [Acacia pycnantha]